LFFYFNCILVCTGLVGASCKSPCLVIIIIIIIITCEQRMELRDIECLEQESVMNLVMQTTREALTYSKFLCPVLIHLNR